MASKKDEPVKAASPAVTKGKAATAATPAPPLKPSPIPGDTFNERGEPWHEGTKTGPLPANFPGYHQLKVAGFATYESARTIHSFTQIAGIDDETAKKIEAELTS